MNYSYLNNCFPVHKGLGFKIAGGGIFPLKLGIHISNCIINSLLINASLLVKIEQPSNVSCTKPEK
jgi:hypothetical protein